MKRCSWLWLFGILLASPACFQTSNSLSDDALRYGENPNSTGGSSSGELRFQAALEILEANCFDCHTGYHDAWTNYDELDFVTDGVIRSGSSATSTMYTKLSGVSGNMPLGRPPLSEDDIETIRAWIDGMDD